MHVGGNLGKGLVMSVESMFNKWIESDGNLPIVSQL